MAVCVCSVCSIPVDCGEILCPYCMDNLEKLMKQNNPSPPKSESPDKDLTFTLPMFYYNLTLPFIIG